MTFLNVHINTAEDYKHVDYLSHTNNRAHFQDLFLFLTTKNYHQMNSKHHHHQKCATDGSELRSIVTPNIAISEILHYRITYFNPVNSNIICTQLYKTMTH